MTETEAIKFERKRILKSDKEYKLRKWIERKIELSKNWIENEQIQKNRRIVQGGVYMCELGENIGSEQGETRPVLVVSNNLINLTSGNVTVIPLTKNLRTKIVNKNGQSKEVPKYKSHYFLYKSKYSFLEFDSAVLGEETKTVSKIRLKEHKGEIDSGDLNKILNRVKWVFGLS